MTYTISHAHRPSLLRLHEPDRLEHKSLRLGKKRYGLRVMTFLHLRPEDSSRPCLSPTKLHQVRPIHVFGSSIAEGAFLDSPFLFFQAIHVDTSVGISVSVSFPAIPDSCQYRPSGRNHPEKSSLAAGGPEGKIWQAIEYQKTR